LTYLQCEIFHPKERKLNTKTTNKYKQYNNKAQNSSQPMAKSRNMTSKNNSELAAKSKIKWQAKF
jgi:hypothetical protein